MFGHLTDPFRGNKTPQQRLWLAEDRLKDAEHAFKQAKKEYEQALAELATFNGSRETHSSQGWGGLF